MSRITQKGATGPLALQANGAFQTSTDLSLNTLVGARWDLSDGRELVLVQNAGTALAPGKWIGGPNLIAAHQACATAAFQAYSNNGNVPAKVTVTLGSTAVTANQYAGGYLVVASGTGAGQTLKIASHPAAALSTNVVITLEDSPNTALVAASSTVNLLLNPYGSKNGTDFTTFGVVLGLHTGFTGSIAGVSLYPIAASTATVPSYGFLVTKGLTACLNDANTTAGLDLMPSTNTDGALMTYAVATGARVGTSTQAGTTTAYGAITVQL
jgi:hypothetical protein